ncbi:hypothetical protein, partial [Alloprevotella tannerae]|uniref:hypothetical protein n=1 Tax=Alloprevotella tannerae TaxID=76122 RepID=UPI0025D78F27
LTSQNEISPLLFALSKRTEYRSKNFYRTAIKKIRFLVSFQKVCTFAADQLQKLNIKKLLKPIKT